MDVTEEQALVAAYRVIYGYWHTTNSYDVSVLLSEIKPVGRRDTADPGMWEDWIDAVRATLGVPDGDQFSLTAIEAYRAVYRLLCGRWPDPDVDEHARQLLEQFALPDPETTPTAHLWGDWIAELDRMKGDA